MKNKILTFLFVIVASVETMLASVTIDGIAFNLNETDLTAEVTSLPSEKYSGNVVIPESVTYDAQAFNVTSIASQAFSGCSGLTSITIPNSVTSIGDYAFSNCTGLTSVTIPNSVTRLGEGAFYGCTGLPVIDGLIYADYYLVGVVDKSLSHYTIKEGTKRIGVCAFALCENLTSITIPNSVTIVEERAFASCSSLKSIEFPNSIISIGFGAFWDCINLTSVTIPESITTIGILAFNGSSNLKSVVWNAINCADNGNYIMGSDSTKRSGGPFTEGVESFVFGNNVETIPAGLCVNMHRLTSVAIPNTVTRIGSQAFYDCTGLTSVDIPNSVTSIGYGAFYGCTALTSVDIPNSVTNIEKQTFAGCTGLTSITIPNSVTSIASQAFSGCTALTSVNISDLTAWCKISFGGKEANPLEYAHNLYLNANLVTNLVIPDSITRILNYAFYGCSGLASVIIPNSVTNIGSYAFYSCTGLTSVTIPNSVTRLGEGAFYGCTGLTSVDIPNSVTNIEKQTFAGCTGLTHVQLPDSATFGYSVFAGCLGLPIIDNIRYADNYLVEAVDKSLSNYTIREGTKIIGESAFAGCPNLTSMTIPEGVIYINYNAFSNCQNLTSITLPGSLIYIFSYAFSDCSGLTSITIPAKVAYILDYAFSNCTGLTSVTCLALTPPRLQSNKNKTFNGVDRSQIPLYVPAESIEAYKAAYVWKGFADILPIPGTEPSCVIVSGYCGAESDTTSLRWEVTCDGILAIMGQGDMRNFRDTFEIPWRDYRQSFIKRVEMSEGITSIGTFAFEECNVDTIVIPQSVTRIGNYAFSSSNVRSVIIHDNITSIGDGAFEYNFQLSYISIPQSVAHIGEHAFNGCYNLGYIYVNRANSHYCDVDGVLFDRDTMVLYQYPCNKYETYYTIPERCDTIRYYAFSGARNLYTLRFNTMRPPYMPYVFQYMDWEFVVPCGAKADYVDAFKVVSADKIREEERPLAYFLSSADWSLGRVNEIDWYRTCDTVFVTAQALPVAGYHFTHWSDGNTTNPRYFIITTDSIKYYAYFAKDTTGLCGKDFALTWAYNAASKTLTISGKGSFDENMECGSEAKPNMEHLVIDEGVTAIGANAFSDCSHLMTVQLPASIKTIGAKAFANCLDMISIHNYRERPCLLDESAFDGVNVFDCTLYVLAGSVDMYKSAASNWKIFYFIEPIGSTAVEEPIEDVQAQPSDNNVTITWPVTDGADTYTLEIFKDDVLFCTLIFSADGQLKGIAFAPGRDGQQAPAAVLTANGGLRFTVTGLDSGTAYSVAVTAKDAEDNELKTYETDFATTGHNTPTSVDQVTDTLSPSIHKVVRNGQILILRGEKIYTLQGQEVK